MSWFDEAVARRQREQRAAASAQNQDRVRSADQYYDNSRK